MNPDRHLEQELRVVVLDGSRLAGLKNWQALADVAALTGGAICAADGVLLDVRQAPFTPATHEGEVLAAALASYPAVAIVTGGDASHSCARTVCTLVELRGSPAAAFLTQDEAELWLSRQAGAAGGGSAATKRLGTPVRP
jgi:hypothetical protein